MLCNEAWENMICENTRIDNRVLRRRMKALFSGVLICPGGCACHARAFSGARQQFPPRRFSLPFGNGKLPLGLTIHKELRATVKTLRFAAFPFWDGVYCLVLGTPPPPFSRQNLENNRLQLLTMC